MAKAESIISSYLTYYVDTTGKTVEQFFDKSDWLSQHIADTMTDFGVTANDIEAYKKSLENGRILANSECLSNSPTYCNLVWKYMEDLIGTDVLDNAVIWDPACGTGRLQKVVDRGNLFMSTIEAEDIKTAKTIISTDKAVIFQNDFLNSIDYDKYNNYFSQNLPESLVEKLESNAPVVFMVEPPALFTENCDIKDIAKHKFSKQDIDNGVLLYFERIEAIIDYYNLSNVYIVMIQNIEFDSWLKNYIYFYKPLGGFCYECNKVMHKYRAAIVWKYDHITSDDEEFKNRQVVKLDKYTIDINNQLAEIGGFKFTIDNSVNQMNRGMTVAYQTPDGCFTNIKTDNSEPVTILDIHNKLTMCVLKHLVASGIAGKNTTIDITLVDDQWFSDCIPLFIFSKFNKFIATDTERNIMFPLNYDALQQHIKDENVLENWRRNPATSAYGRELVKNNFTKLSNTSRVFLEFCINQIMRSYANGVRAGMNYADGTINWDAGISQIRSLSTIWSVETENTYNELQNDLVNFLAQGLIDCGAYKEG